MNNEEMKKFYETGEWILLLTYGDKPWKVAEMDSHPLWSEHWEYKLIHKLDKEVLAHVLSGGEVKVKTTVVGGWIYIHNINDFINDYSKGFIYEIIPTKPTLNPMHLHNNEWVFGSLEHEEICDLCNGEGGSVVSYDPYMTQPCPSCNGYEPEEPKPVERITREEASALCMMEALGGDIGRDRRKQFNELFDYIEYLEANQKETK